MLEREFYKLVMPEGKQNYILEGQAKILFLLCQEVDKLVELINVPEKYLVSKAEIARLQKDIERAYQEGYEEGRREGE